LSEPRPRCSEAARARGDQLAATASHVRNWLLIEQPGAWGIDALLQSSLPSALARELHRRGHELRIRVVLIRQSDRRPGGVNVFLAHTGGSRTEPLLLHGVLDDPAALLEFDLQPLTRGRPIGFGRPEERPLYLVCTNGRHDVCCAERGRPIFRALAAELPERTWECSHIGGDRFAGNIVCLPRGDYFGWVEPGDAIGIARRYELGALDLEHHRGRSSWPRDLQAADRYVRQRDGLAAFDDLRPVTRTRIDASTRRVVLEGSGGERHDLLVRIIREQEHYLTCRAAEPASARAFDVAERP
jgi:hypothetical protein